MTNNNQIADTGMNYNLDPGVEVSNIGPALLALFAFFIFAQGLIYILKPDMTGRSLTISKEKLRRWGILIVVFSGLILYYAFSWWVESLSVAPPPVDPR